MIDDQVLNITPGMNIDAAAALAIKAASASLRAAENNARVVDAGHGLPELEPIMGARASSPSSPAGDSQVHDDVSDHDVIPDNFDETRASGGGESDDSSDDSENDGRGKLIFATTCPRNINPITFILSA